MRISHLVLFAVFCALGACVYHVANLYQTAERQMRRLNVSIEHEHENIRVLSAEWAYLTNPARLEKLAQDYLELHPFDGSQLVATATIPLRAELDETHHAAHDGKAAKNPHHTGSAFMPILKATPVKAGGMHE